MNVANIYRKSLTFLSRTRQQKIVSKIEQEFYHTFTVYAQNPQSLHQLQLKLEKVCSKIRYHMVHDYFEDDLLDHMFNLLTFITNYITELKTEKYLETSSRASLSKSRISK